MRATDATPGRARRAHQSLRARVTRSRVADTIAGLAEQIGVDPTRLSAAIAAYDASIESARPFGPTIEQGRRANVAPPRSNWPSALETPLFHANRPLQLGIRSNSVL